MDVSNPEQARIAEAAGACAVMALERIPQTSVRLACFAMSDPKMIRSIQEAVSIPVMAKVRIGHICEAQILQAIEIDFIDEVKCCPRPTTSTTLTRRSSPCPLWCGARTSRGPPPHQRRRRHDPHQGRTRHGDIIQAVRHMRLIMSEMRRIQSNAPDELFQAPRPCSRCRPGQLRSRKGKLPVVNFPRRRCHPARAALMMQLRRRRLQLAPASSNPATPPNGRRHRQAVTTTRMPKCSRELSKTSAKPWSDHEAGDQAADGREGK